MGAVRKTWADRALDKAATSAESLNAAAEAIALACAPVKPAPRFDPLNMAGVPTYTVWIEPVRMAESGAPVAEEVAGLRAYLKRPQAWGPTRKVSVLMESSSLGMVHFLIEAPMGAIAHAVPDRETIKSWAQAAAIAVPLMLDPEPSDEAMRFVPIHEMPSVLQVEYASRSTFEADEDVTRGSHDADEASVNGSKMEPSAKDTARALVTMFDVRSEAAALAYRGVGLA